MSPSWSTLSCVLLVLAILLGAALAKSLPAAVYLLSFWHYALYWLAFAFGASDFDVFKRNAMAMKTVSVTALAFVYLSAPIDLVSLAVILGGGLLNLREKRRLPIRLQVTYGAVEGPANTFTKDINEEGVFLFTDKPLPETSQVHMLVTVPGKPQPLSLVGKVSHTILAADEEPPGMGIVFDLDDAQREQLTAVIKELEELLEKGALPKTTLE